MFNFFNLTDTDSCSISGFFVSDLTSKISETDARHLIFKTML